MTAQGLINQYKAINLQKLAVDSMTENMDLMKELNQDQLLHGQAPDGGKIKQYKKPKSGSIFGGFSAYAVEKNAQNPLPGLGNADLILTGSFRNQFKYFISGIKIFGESTDIKMDKLIDWVGDSKRIFGITTDNRTKFMTTLRTTFFTKLRA